MKGKVLLIRLALLTGLMMLSPPTVLAGPLEGVFCNGNFDGDLDVDAEDVTEFLIHFGRGQYSDPCPPDPFAPVEKTGQTTSYYTGDDGELEKGVTWPNPRFTDNGDGTVTDNLTLLIWLKNANCFGQREWDEALSACNGLAAPSCGLSDGSTVGDWRLPNVREFQDILDYGRNDPAVPLGHPFINLMADHLLDVYYLGGWKRHRTHSIYQLARCNELQ